MREPYTAVGYVAARLPLVELLGLQHPNTVATVFKKTKGKRTGDFELDEPCHVTSEASHVTAEPQEWTAWDLCDGNYNYDLLAIPVIVEQVGLLFFQRGQTREVTTLQEEPV